MIRERIFRLKGHRSSLSSFDASAGQKFDFSFSNIQALQVPKGWDRVVLSMISSETGKTVRKSGKVQVKNGTCQWTETLFESIWISDVISSKETDEYLLKFIVSTGSSKSGVLGETMLNLATFLSSESSTLVPLPLQKCSHGTILQVEVTCLTPRSCLISHEKWKTASEVESCSSSSNFGNSSHPGELISFSPPVSRYSFDSTDDNSVGRQSPSSRSDQNGYNNTMARQDSVESSDVASYSPHSTVKSVRSNQGSFAKETNGKSQRQELEIEARMWEQNATKLSQDLETTRKELYASQTGCQELSQEIEQLKSLMEEPVPKRSMWRYSEIRGMTGTDMQKELEDEIRFQMEQSEHMSIQLKKTQESNIELIALLREMEETVEKQKRELKRYEEMDLDYTNSKKDCRNEEPDELVSVINEVSAGEVKSFHELLNLQDLLRTSQDRILFLESKLEDNIIENEIEKDLRNHVLKRGLVEFSDRLDDKELKIMNLEAALLEALSDGNLKSEQGGRGNHSKEIELPNVEIEERETDGNKPCESPNAELPTTDVQCLTDETQEYGPTVVEANAVSLQTKMDIKVPSYCQEITERDCTTCTSDCFSRSLSDTILYNSSSSSTSSHVSDNNVEEINTQWAKYVAELEEENIYVTQRVYGLEAQLRYLTDAKESCFLELQHARNQVMVLRNQVSRLEEEIESQKLNTKEKLQGMEKQWSEARDECERLGKLNVKLQTTTETLVDECSLLQKLVEKMKERKLKLEDRCQFLEAEARKFQDGFCTCTVTTTEDSRHKLLVNELESKLRDSELRKVRLAEENYVLRMQLQKVPELQNEVLGLRVSLKETMSETRLLKGSFKSLSKDYEKQKREQLSMIEKLCSMTEAVSEAEDCRRKKIALEEKVLRLEGDLIGREQLCTQDAEMKHELSRMKILNSQLVIKVKHLEEAIEHLHCKLQLCEGGRTHAAKSHRKTVSEPQNSDYYFVPEGQRNSAIYPSQSNEHMKSQDNNNGRVQHTLQVSSKQKEDSIQSHILGMDCEPRPGLLGNEQGEDPQVQAVVSKEMGSKETTDTAEPQHNISMLEAELQELRERYRQMSLKYAQVEVQREGLVMKLKAFSN